MSRRLILVGAGGHAKVVAAAIRAMGGFEIIGAVDRRRDAAATLRLPDLGDDGALFAHTVDADCVAIGIGTTSASDRRADLFRRLQAAGYAVATVVHPSAVVLTAAIGEGTQIMARAVVQPDAAIAENCIINTGAVIEHDCRIGAHAHVAPGAVLGGHVTVGECAMVGLGARVLPGVDIGARAVVGAGAVVVHDVGDGETVVGIPARRLVKAR